MWIFGGSDGGFVEVESSPLAPTPGIAPARRCTIEHKGTQEDFPPTSLVTPGLGRILLSEWSESFSSHK